MRIDLERPSGVLPESENGTLDAWSARAVATGDVLREVPAILAALDTAPSPAAAASFLAASRDTRVALPLHAAVTTTAGFASAGEASLSRTSLDVSGALGGGVRWGASGQYARLADLAGEKAGDASRVALDVIGRILPDRPHRHAPPEPVGGRRPRALRGAFRWTGTAPSPSTPQAAVSARVISQSHLLATGPAADLFARESDAVDVAARYQTDLGSSTFARVTVGYRSTSGDYAGAVTPFERETRAGAVAGLRLGDLFVVEAGATGDTSLYGARRHAGAHGRASTRRTAGSIYGFAARRFETLSQDLALRPGEAGADEADLTRRSRSLYRGGVRWQNRDGEGLAVDVSRRELNGTYRLLFDADFLDRLDSLYFFPNDVATDASLTVSARIGNALDGRVSLRAGELSGARDGVIRSDDASWGVAQAALRVRATDTSVGVGYRQVVAVPRARHRDAPKRHPGRGPHARTGAPAAGPARARKRLAGALLRRVRQAARGRRRGEVQSPDGWRSGSFLLTRSPQIPIDRFKFPFRDCRLRAE